MSGLDAIPVRVENGLGAVARTDNLRPVLLQLEQALSDLLHNGAESIIDLAAMPFTEQDERDLRETLGRGEVSASIEAFGPTLIEETAFPGIWLVEHQDADQRRLTLHLEVTRIPAILAAPVDDLRDSLAALQHKNSQGSDSPTEDVQ